MHVLFRKVAPPCVRVSSACPRHCVIARCHSTTATQQHHHRTLLHNRIHILRTHGGDAMSSDVQHTLERVLRTPPCTPHTAHTPQKPQMRVQHKLYALESGKPRVLNLNVCTHAPQGHSSARRTQTHRLLAPQMARAVYAAGFYVGLIYVRIELVLCSYRHKRVRVLREAVSASCGSATLHSQVCVLRVLKD